MGSSSNRTDVNPRLVDEIKRLRTSGGLPRQGRKLVGALLDAVHKVPELKGTTRAQVEAALASPATIPEPRRGNYQSPSWSY